MNQVQKIDEKRVAAESTIAQIVADACQILGDRALIFEVKTPDSSGSTTIDMKSGNVSVTLVPGTTKMSSYRTTANGTVRMIYEEPDSYKEYGYRRVNCQIKDSFNGLDLVNLLLKLEQLKIKQSNLRCVKADAELASKELFARVKEKLALPDTYTPVVAPYTSTKVKITIVAGEEAALQLLTLAKQLGINLG